MSADLDLTARRLLAALAPGASRTVQRLAHDAGLGGVPAIAAAKELRQAGLVTATSPGTIGLTPAGRACWHALEAARQQQVAR